MYDIYAIARGPLAWVAFLLFFGGSLYRLIAAFLTARKKDHVVYSYFSPYYAMRSLLHWIIPFGSVSMRKRPVFTLVAFAFHVSLIAAPVFLFAHIIVFKESWNVAWWHLPNTAADALTVIVVLACLFFLLRRFLRPEVRYLTEMADYVLLVVVAAPFVTGFWSSHGWYGFETASILHMLTGELLLASIPFTRLSHMFFFPLTRGYAGSEFGGVRNARDW